ncbi:MAG TPA: ATP-binding cassette domain-containing protein [Candidatus Cloacimonadota bacterium]|nr:ATP-binding cassette domain-containing protein [Candidatus Cloacimonadota bacterium]
MIELKGLVTSAIPQALDLCLKLDPVTVLRSANPELASGVLNAIVGLDRVYSGRIELDGQPLSDVLTREALPKTLGYVFAGGIMLSNLNLRENLLLPYTLVAEEEGFEQFDREAAKWMDAFQLKVDLSLRPAFVRASDLKLLSLVRALIFNPRILLLDDPYYLLNQDQRQLCYRVLQSIKNEHSMLISSRDDDFCCRFGAELVDLSEDSSAIS